MGAPVVVERFADNGEHSHWDLIDSGDGKTLWSEGVLVQAQATDSIASEMERALPKVYVDGDEYNIYRKIAEWCRQLRAL